jgi:organic radical activating enzyme
MDFSLFQQIVDQVSKWEGSALRFTGWGEPLMHPQIGAMVEAAKKNGLKLKLYTNGLALNEELMDIFIEAGLDDLQFSMQGLNQRQYLFNRVGSDYNKLKKNIFMAAKRRGGRARPFLSLLTSVLETELSQVNPVEFTDYWLKTVDKVAVDLTNLKFVAQSQRVKPYLNQQSKALNRGKCIDIFLALEVKYDGSIQFCGQDSQALHEHTIGSFPNISLYQAWHSSKINAQRDLVGRGEGHDKLKVCQNCYHNTDKYELFKKSW